jgi:hypothetical protein
MSLFHIQTDSDSPVINSNGERVRPITAASAIRVYNANPANSEMLQRANILTGIDRNAHLGEIYYTYWPLRDVEVPETTIDWFIQLGYAIRHTANITPGGQVDHAYSFYWTYPPDTVIPFAPGITHTHY